MGGGFGGGGGTEMVFINIRDTIQLPEGGLKKLANDFQGLLQTGGLNIPIMDVDNHQLIAVCNNLFQVIELRKFFIELEEVASLIHDKETYWGVHITEEEKKRHEAKKK